MQLGHRRRALQVRLGQYDLEYDFDRDVFTAPATAPTPVVVPTIIPAPTPVPIPTIARPWTSDDWMALFDAAVGGPAMFYKGVIGLEPGIFRIGFIALGIMTTVRGATKLRERLQQ